MNKQIEHNKEEKLFQTYLSRIINSAFEAGLVEREKRFIPNIIEQALRDIVKRSRQQERERIIERIVSMKRYTGGSSVEPKDLRVNLKEVMDIINN